MKRFVHFLAILLICCTGLNLLAAEQQLKRNVAVCAYVYNFAKNIQWPDEAQFKEFNFLILGQDQNIIMEMKNLARSKTIRGKPIRVTTAEALTDLSNLQLIFLLKEKDESLTRIFDQIEGKNILLVTDGYQDKKLIMINFFESGKGTLQFEINKANILNQDLRIMQDMILLGGTEVDVAALYREGQQSLRSLQKNREDLEKKLKNSETSLSLLENSIANLTKEIKNNRDSLERQSQKIEEQERVLDSQSLLLRKREQEMGLQLLKLQDQQKTYDLQRQELGQQKVELENGTNKLADQRKEIASQSEVLEEQGQKIHRQQSLVYLLVIIILLVIVLFFNIFRSYRIKQKLSKELEIRVVDRTTELNDSNKLLLTELSERRQAEKRLTESETKYRTLLENLPQKIFFKNSELTFVSCNENFARELNIASSQIKGKTDYDFFPTELAEKYRKEDFDFLASGKLMEIETSEVRDGQIYWTQVVKIPVRDENDNIVGIQGIFWDITERKLAELELDKYRRQLEEMVEERTQELSENEVSLKKALQAAESADQLKSAFLATMSHELRTPLNSIIGFTGMLLQELPGPLNAEQKKQLGMTQKSGRHLLSLINDILDLSKIEAGQLNLSSDKFKISEVIQNVLELSRPFAQSKNLLLTSRVDPRLTEIISDQFRVQQVIINLVNNALKFTETGSVEVIASEVDKYLVVAVTDTGMGIEAEQIKILFKPFIQIDSGTTRKHDGTGLGLSISQKLMTMLGGNISVESEYGKGSTFTIKLPLGTVNNG